MQIAQAKEDQWHAYRPQTNQNDQPMVLCFDNINTPFI
jgi:hypothetical protein